MFSDTPLPPPHPPFMTYIDVIATVTHSIDGALNCDADLWRRAVLVLQRHTMYRRALDRRAPNHCSVLRRRAALCDDVRLIVVRWIVVLFFNVVLTSCSIITMVQYFS